MHPQTRFHLGLSVQGFHKLHYLEWGEEKNDQVVVCVHGVSRNAHDFDFLAPELTSQYRVICPDVVGRGHSDWLNKPELYTFPQYLTDATALIARTGVEKLDWIGTSMGGIIGMMIAAQPQSPIRRLILNDIGPFVPAKSMKRIRTYLKVSPKFKSLKVAETLFRLIFAPFGHMTEEQWKHLVKYSLIKQQNGSFILARDPAIGRSILLKEDVNLWPLWHQIRCPVLLLRGEKSDILSPEVVEQMKQTKPDLQVVEIPNVGHAPTLADPTQIEIIKSWLAQTVA